MRIYLPLSLADLQADGPVLGREAFAANPALRALAPDADDEGAEYIAFLAAADAAIDLAGTSRIVVAADQTVTDTEVPGVVQVSSTAWADIVSIHIDDLADATLAPKLQAALAGDPDAREQINDGDLLWYDVSERASVIELLTNHAG